MTLPAPARRAAALVCLLAAAAAGAEPDGGQATSRAAQTARDPQEALRALFARPAPADASDQIDAVLDACRHDAAAVKKLLLADAAYELLRPGLHRRTVRVMDGKKAHDVEFALRVPRGYRRDKPHPLLLAAHGQYGTGRGMVRMALGLLGPAADDYILLAPTMPGPRHYNGKAYQEQAYLRPLQWTRRHLNVDDDRICLTGYSMGGHTAWHLATLYPRHFAAAVPLAGVPWFEGFPYTVTVYLENLANLPLWAVWGERDRPAPPAMGNVHFCRAADKRLRELKSPHYKGTEMPGVGHAGCFPKPRDFAAFLAAGKRTPAPAKLAHFFHHPRHGRGYYLEAIKLTGRPMRMDKPIRVKFTHKPTEAEAQRRMADHFRKYLFKMWAELDRPKNTLTVRARRVSGVRVYVIDGMFDPGRPVMLRFGGRSWRGKVTPSARCMLTHYAADRDAAALVCNEIDLHTTGRVVVRYK